MNNNVANLANSELIDKYFNFLIEFGFKRVAKDRFENEKIRLVFEFESTKSVAPTITVWVKSEPKFTSIGLGWLLEEHINYDRLWKSKSFEANVAYYASVLHNNIGLLINGTNDLLIRGLKRLFVNILKSNRLTKQSFMNNMPAEARQYYYYIKRRDPKWDPGKEL
jgi:hypothetical protein